MVLAVSLLLLGACGSDGADSSAVLACRDFRSVVRDAQAGVLTDTELRDKLKGVEDTASVSEEPGVASSAREMLAAATAGNTEALAAAGDGMAEACRAADA